jgi:hypothetical protein
MVHQPPITMKDAPMSMMLKLGALPTGATIMVHRGDSMKNTVLHKCQLLSKTKNKGRLVQSP